MQRPQTWAEPLPFWVTEKLLTADGADLALPRNSVCMASAVSSIVTNGSGQWDLVDVDVIGTEPSQRVLDLL